MFIYREEYYMERKKASRRAEEDDTKFYEREARYEENLEKVKGLAEVIIAKQRHGPIGDLTMTFTGEFARFGDHEWQHDNNR
jgi:replicative DNA helicase